MAITLSREAYVKFRRFGRPDQYPKDIRGVEKELQQRGYDASVSVLQYLIEEDLIDPKSDRWTEADIDAAARELEEREAYNAESQFFLHLDVDAAEYFQALHSAWEGVRRTVGRETTPIEPDREYFVMTVHPRRGERDGYVEFTSAGRPC